MPNDNDRWGIWVKTQPGCEPVVPPEVWLHTKEGKPMVLSRRLAEALTKASNEVNGHLWLYEARELPGDEDCAREEHERRRYSGCMP